MKFRPEPQTSWARPTEVSFEMRSRIESEASVTKVLFFTVAGEKPTDVSFLSVIGDVLKGDTDGMSDPLVRHAATKAIDDSKADGLYVLRTEVKETGIWPLFEQRTAWVKGISLVVKDLGPVSAERADKERLLKISPNAFTVSEPAR